MYFILQREYLHLVVQCNGVLIKSIFRAKAKDWVQIKPHQVLPACTGATGPASTGRGTLGPTADTVLAASCATPPSLPTPSSRTSCTFTFHSYGLCGVK